MRAASSAGPLVLGRVRDFTVACSCSLPLSSDWRAATRAGSVPCADGSRKSTIEHRHSTLADLKLIHTAMPDTTKLSCPCRVRFGGVNWIPDNSRLSPTENLKTEHVNNNCPIHSATPDTTQTGLSCRVYCGGVNWAFTRPHR